MLQHCWQDSDTYTLHSVKSATFFLFSYDMFERWANKCLTVLTATMMRARNRPFATVGHVTNNF